MASRTAHFRFGMVGRLTSLPFGIAPNSATATISGAHLFVRFGPWHVVTPVENIDSAEVTGPYAPWKVLGPPHLSLADRGLTFGTNSERGVCLRFHDPVRGLDPFGVFRHPGLTITVEDPDEFVAEVDEAREHLDRLETEEEDDVKAKTASELRSIAKELGIERSSSMKKDELVEAVERAIENQDTAPTALAALEEE